MRSRSKQMLWFGAGIGVGFTAAYATELLMFIMRRPARGEEMVQWDTGSPAPDAPQREEVVEHLETEEVPL